MSPSELVGDGLGKVAHRAVPPTGSTVVEEHTDPSRATTAAHMLEAALRGRTAMLLLQGKPFKKALAIKVVERRMELTDRLRGAGPIHCVRLHPPNTRPCPPAQFTWSWRKRILAWLIMCSTTMEVFPKELWFLERAARASTPSVSTTICRNSGSGRLLRTLSTRRANFSSPGVI